MRAEFLKNWGTCIRLRGLMEGRTIEGWAHRIAEADSAELRRIAAELKTLVGYQGKMRYKPSVAQAGQRQAQMFLEQTLQAIYERDFVLPLREFRFPYPNEEAAAERVVAWVRDEISALYEGDRRVVLKEKSAVLNAALRNRFDEEVRWLYEEKGREGEVGRLFESKAGGLPVGAQNIFLLKMLEMVMAHKPNPWAGLGLSSLAEQGRNKSWLEEMVWSVLNRLPAERLAGLTSKQAAAAVFFMFRFGEFELNALWHHYVFDLIAGHPNPDELVRAYLSLDVKERHNLFALRDVTPSSQFCLRSPDSRGWVYDDQRVVAAIQAGDVRNFREVIYWGRQGRFFNSRTGPTSRACYQPPERG